MSSKGKEILLTVVVLGLAGWLARGVSPPGMARGVREAHGLPQVTVLAWECLGGLRPLGANVAWLQLQGTWQQREAAATAAWIRMATGLDPQSLYFWANGARILAYDMPVWLDGGTGSARRRQAEAALALLEMARPWQSENPHYWIERAGIELNAADDPAGAAESYRRAAELPGAPYYAGRLHAEGLMRLGRFAEAHAWLCKLHPKLPADDPRAQAEVVLMRIRVLEARLQLPAEARYGAGPDGF